MYHVLAVFVLLYAAHAFGRSVQLTWNLVSGVDGYYVYRGTSVNNLAKISGLITITAYVDTHVPAGTYVYAVTSYYASNGKESAYSNEPNPYVPSNCDIDGNKSVNATDYTDLVNTIINKRTTFNGLSADVNMDGKVNVLDSQVEANVLGGKQQCPN